MLHVILYLKTCTCIIVHNLNCYVLKVNRKVLHFVWASCKHPVSFKFRHKALNLHYKEVPLREYNATCVVIIFHEHEFNNWLISFIKV